MNGVRDAPENKEEEEEKGAWMKGKWCGWRRFMSWIWTEGERREGLKIISK